MYAGDIYTEQELQELRERGIVAYCVTPLEILQKRLEEVA